MKKPTQENKEQIEWIDILIGKPQNTSDGLLEKLIAIHNHKDYTSSIRSSNSGIKSPE
jgi:hypothetical protein